MKKNIYIAVLFIVVHLSAVHAQIVTQYVDESVKISSSLSKITGDLKCAIPLKKIQAFNAINELRNDSASSAIADKTMHCFAKMINVSFSLKDGIWHEAEGGRVWCLELFSANAVGMNVGFENLFIPDGAELYIVNADQTMIYGPVSSSNIPDDQVLLTNFLDGDKVRICLYEPDSVKNRSRLNIANIGHAFSSGETKGHKLLPCHNDVMCHSGWEKESNAIVQIEFPKGEWYYNGTGALIMNTRKDFKPYVLTAFHCVDQNRDNWLSESEKNAISRCTFTFGYKKNTCNGTVGSVTTFNGAKFRAAWLKTDMALLELNNVILSRHHMSFLGWDRSDQSSPRGTCIHHPEGQVMKISFTDQSIAVYNKPIGWEDEGNQYYISEPGTHWECVMNNGTAQYGSSGSPLLNAARRVIGQLHGGDEICPPVSKFFGRFDLSWEGGGTSDTQLKCWLDPDNTGSVTMNTQLKDWKISGSNNIYVGNNTTFTVNDLPENAIINWSVMFPNFTLHKVDDQTVKVVPHNYDVSTTLTAKILLDGAICDNLSKTIYSYPLSIEGDDTVSGLVSTCRVNFLPEGATLEWTCSDGITISSCNDLEVVFKGCNVKDGWVEATVTDKEGNKHVKRHELHGIAPIESAELTLIKTWYAENSEGVNVKKYAFRVNYTPDIPLERLNFCWANTVVVKPKKGTSHLVSMLGGAKMRTKGNKGICLKMVALKDSIFHLKPRVTPAYVDPIPGPLPDVPFFIEQAIWSQTVDHVIVEMPAIDLDEIAEGKLTCTLQDYCGNSCTTPPEVVFSQWNYVYHAAPNPATDVITISRSNENQTRSVVTYSTAVPEIITANLYNDQTLVRTFKFESTQGHADMNVGNLPEGTYYLNILEGDKVVSRQVILIKR